MRHQAEFEALLAEIRADEKIEMVGIGEARYSGHSLSQSKDLSEMESLGLSRDRWTRYQELLRELGVRQVFREKTGISFKVDRESFLNGDSYKGYEYDDAPPDHLKADLDAYRITEDDKDGFGNYYVSKPLKGHWYLYLFVSR